MLLMILMSSCSKEDSEDYVAIASAISNSILLDVQDSEGNSLVENEEYVKGITLIQSNGYKYSGRIVDIDGKQFVESAFPLPLKSAMYFTGDGQSGYGEQQLTILIGDSKYELQGVFHFSSDSSDRELYGGSVIRLIEIKSNNPAVSESEEYGSYIKIVITVANI
ncbi:MAG: hypothetical protein K2K75_00905 [Muribaculaceae bacterium]|nr:hypothetical protein [Muribaculaceae bacterium]